MCIRRARMFFDEKAYRDYKSDFKEYKVHNGLILQIAK